MTPARPLTRPRLAVVLLSLAGLLAVAIGLAATFGAGKVSLFQLLGLGAPLAEVDRVILWNVRLPRVLLAAVIGGSLTATGVVFQALLRNPLADPYVLGVSGGASLGGVLAVLLGLGQAGAGLAGLGVPAAAFLGALGALVLIERLATVDGRLTVYSVLLTGAVFNATSAALIYFLQSIASLQQLHAIVFYLLGSIPSLGYGSLLGVTLAAVVANLGLLALARDFNALSLGEEGAAQLGVEIERLKRWSFVIGSLLTGLAVAVAGMIGFVGLIVPHLLRLLFGSDHRLLLPAAFLAGGTFLVLADLVARVVLVPNELPVGVVTALAGGPFFLYLLRRSRGRYGV